MKTIAPKRFKGIQAAVPLLSLLGFGSPFHTHYAVSYKLSDNIPVDETSLNQTPSRAKLLKAQFGRGTRRQRARRK